MLGRFFSALNGPFFVFFLVPAGQAANLHIAERVSSEANFLIVLL